MDHSITPPTVEEKPAAGRKWRWVWLTAVAVVLLALGGWGLWSAGLIGPREFNGTVIQSPHPQANFTLYTSGDTPVNLHDFRDKVVVIYFGYTFCPDACPATMVELKKAVVELGAAAEDVQVLMVSVDPLRDTPEEVDEYVKHFHPSFIGLTGTEDEILAVTTPLGVFYEKHEGTAETGYLIDHTTTVTVVDKKGHLRLVYPFNTTGSEMAADLRYLIRD